MGDNDFFNVPHSLSIQRQHPKTGPSPLFLCWRPNLSVYCLDAKSVIRFARWPASTPTGAALRQWLSFETKPAPEPNDNTKTII